MRYIIILVLAFMIYIEAIMFEMARDAGVVSDMISAYIGGVFFCCVLWYVILKGA
jgi:hypothetical protein